MRKRNLFSKIVAGIGALAMVATMLPAMATPSKADASPTAINFTLNSADEMAHWKAKIITKSEFTNGVSLTDIATFTAADYEFRNNGGALTTVTVPANRIYDDSSKIYLLLVPDVYYEFPDGAVLSKTTNTANDSTNVWSTADASNGRYPFDNKTFAKNPQDNREAGASYVVELPVDHFRDGINAITYTFAEVRPIILNIKIKVGEGIDAGNGVGTSVAKQGVTNGGELNFYMWWDDTVDNVATTNNIRISQRPNNLGGYVGNTNYISTTEDDIRTAPLNTAGQRRLTINAEGKRNMAIKINDATFSSHALVAQSITASGRTDTNQYIEFSATPNPSTDALKPGRDTTPATAPFKYTETDPTTDGTNDGTAIFSIWWDKLFALYFHGLANTDNGKTNDAFASLATRDATGFIGVNAYGTYFKNRTLTIELGGTLNEGDVTFVNDPRITDRLSVASVYARRYVFRDENGKRFDTTPDRGVNSYDPDEATLEDQKEGTEIKFQILFDTNYEPGSNFKVWMEGESGVAVDITDKKGEDGIYTVKLGDDFNYRIYATEPVEKKTRKVVNQPEADAKYESTHLNKDGAAVSEAEYQDFRNWDLYSPFMYTNWMSKSGSCNVAEPRYMIYLQANEEDEEYLDIFPFAVRRAVGTADADYLGHDFAVGTYKFKIRYTNEFVGSGHGTFNESTFDDRYAAGPDFKVTQDGTALTPDADGLYTLTVTEGTEPIILKVDGVVRTYHVYAPNLAAYDIETDGIDMNRDKGDNFVSSVAEGSKYRFKINLNEGVTKGPNFKVELAQWEDGAQRGDYMDSVVRTQVPEGADGWYEFTVNNDVEIIVSGIIGGEGFSDTSNRSAEEQEAINWLKDQNVIEGYGDDSFRPGNNLTRAEFVKMLYALKGGKAGSAAFSDTASHWAKDMIGWGSGEGVVNGYPDGTFRPDASISRAEVCQIMWKLNGKPAANMVANFADVNQGAWYAPAVNSCFEKGIVKGYGNGFFGTNDPIERAHMALILYRAR